MAGIETKRDYIIMALIGITIIILLYYAYNISQIPKDPCGACQTLYNMSCVKLQIPTYS